MVKSYLMETLADWLEKEIKNRGWKPADLARSAKMTDGTLSRILSGSRGAGPETCNRLADALDVPPERVLRLAGHLPPASPVVEEEEEAVHLLRSLSEQARGYAMTILHALRGDRPTATPGTINETQITYDAQSERQPRTIKERFAYDVAQQLEQLTPDDQRRVIDLMRRLSSEQGRTESQQPNGPLEPD